MTMYIDCIKVALVTQLVEHLLRLKSVVGSNPIHVRSFIKKVVPGFLCFALTCFFTHVFCVLS